MDSRGAKWTEPPTWRYGRRWDKGWWGGEPYRIERVERRLVWLWGMREKAAKRMIPRCLQLKRQRSLSLKGGGWRGVWEPELRAHVWTLSSSTRILRPRPLNVYMAPYNRKPVPLIMAFRSLHPVAPTYFSAFVPTTCHVLLLPSLRSIPFPKLLGHSWNPVCISFPQIPHQSLLLDERPTLNIKQSPPHCRTIYILGWRHVALDLSRDRYHSSISWYHTFQSKIRTPGLTTRTHLEEEGRLTFRHTVNTHQTVTDYEFMPILIDSTKTHWTPTCPCTQQVLSKEPKLDYQAPEASLLPSFHIQLL